MSTTILFVHDYLSPTPIQKYFQSLLESCPSRGIRYTPFNAVWLMEHTANLVMVKDLKIIYFSLGGSSIGGNFYRWQVIFFQIALPQDQHIKLKVLTANHVRKRSTSFHFNVGVYIQTSFWNARFCKVKLTSKIRH